MSTSPRTNPDTIAEQETPGTALHASSSNNKRNAFTALMSPQPKKTSKDQPNTRTRPPFFLGRDGLGAYTKDPASFPLSRVIYYTEEFVAINDLYPKSSIHTLLLWRSPKNVLHPFEAFEDADFLVRIKAEVAKLRGMVAQELRRKYGSFSTAEKAREQALNGESEISEGEDLPKGRDWEKEVMVGVHAHPSMNHLHVHILSVDRYSECLKHRKHYNSFSTPFLLPIDDFPLAKGDPRKTERYLDWDLKCWRCDRNFGNSFSKLKVHLAEEFEEWKKE